VDVVAFAAAPMPEGTAFLMVSRPLREKGLPEFFEAAALVRRRFPGATFTWLGPMRDANPSAIDEVTLRRWLARGDVRHEPERADIRGTLAACTVFVLPSHREGTSKVVLEAMATGRCVVTTDAPGCAQVIEHGQSGLTVRTGSAEALAAAMASLCDDPATARRMGTAARARAERLYRSELVDGLILSALLAR
ncbi:MAG: glycosyltransferase, partial [Planctomycetota bacterium]